MKRRTIVLASFAALASVGVTAPTLAARWAPSARGDAHALAGAPRVRVQVLNATRVRGLARRAMLHLRDRGFDVVEVGTSKDLRDTTVILDRSGHPEWAKQVAAAIGRARIESRPDSSRYLDITVLLGGSWRAPAKPFYP